MHCETFWEQGQLSCALLPQEVSLGGLETEAKKETKTRICMVSQPQYYWHFELENSLLGGWRGLSCRMLNSILGFYLLDASKTYLLSPTVTTKMSPDSVKCP